MSRTITEIKSDSVNKGRIEKRAKALLEVYTETRNKMPSVENFIKDYYAISGGNLSNKHVMIQTLKILSDLHKSHKEKTDVKVYVKINI